MYKLNKSKKYKGAKQMERINSVAFVGDLIQLFYAGDLILLAVDKVDMAMCL